MASSRPNWKLPAGVSRGTWDYVSSKAIAEQYDAYVAGNPLLQLDLLKTRELVIELQALRQSQSVVVADLGCGTGRVAEALLPTGCHMLNVDLSESMLSEVNRKVPEAYSAKNETIHASLVDVGDVLPETGVDLAVCLFSSLGMIRGREHRRKCLAGTFKSLKPGGKVLLHAHNRYRSLFDPGGMGWLAKTWIASTFGSGVEFGDRVYAYRGLPKMFLHIYSRRELLRDFECAGFRSLKIEGVDSTGSNIVKKSLGWPLTAGGFFVTATK